MTQPIDVGELRRLHEAATPPPWKARHPLSRRRMRDSPSLVNGPGNQTPAHGYGRFEDIDLIVAARNALPELLSRLEALEAENGRLKLPQRAATFAFVAHEGQKRKYNGRPYIEHPMRVAFAASHIPDVPEFVVAAAWLHDVIEDCPVMSSDLDKEFGAEVTNLVCELTNPSKLHKHLRRAERKAMDREHIAKCSRWAKILKLIDRCDNLREMIGCDDDFRFLYADESRQLVAAITDDDESIRGLAALCLESAAALAAGRESR